MKLSDLLSAEVEPKHGDVLHEEDVAGSPFRVVWRAERRAIMVQWRHGGKNYARGVAISDLPDAAAVDDWIAKMRDFCLKVAEHAA